MNYKKQNQGLEFVTDRKLSGLLKSAGLPQETYLYWHKDGNLYTKFNLAGSEKNRNALYTSAWTCDELNRFLPESVTFRHDEYFFCLMKHGNLWQAFYTADAKPFRPKFSVAKSAPVMKRLRSISDTSEVGAKARMILSLINKQLIKIDSVALSGAKGLKQK
jgi:hypothetical protein